MEGEPLISVPCLAADTIGSEEDVECTTRLLFSYLNDVFRSYTARLLYRIDIAARKQLYAQEQEEASDEEEEEEEEEVDNEDCDKVE